VPGCVTYRTDDKCLSLLKLRLGLQRRRQVARHLPEWASEGRPRGVSTRILIADDLPDTAQSLALLLSLFGAEVRCVFDGQETLRVAAEFRPEIVLLDIGMPRMNGYEVARTLRAAPWGRELILLALTGWGRSSDQAAARAAGFDDYLLKPFAAEAVFAAIERVRAARARPVIPP
jgi:CheY-like chemotaxis protein